MIFEIIKQRVVNELIKEVASLDATDIELVGHNLVSAINEQRMVHHGINKNYRPVGYTVDSFSQNSSIIAEYSVEKGYFDNNGSSDNPRYSKIEKDLSHAVSHNSSTKIEKIYLLTSQEEKESFRQNFNKTSWFTSYGNIIEILDARELAKIIYEQSITSTLLANFYKQFFPSLSQNLDNYEYYGKLPVQCQDYVYDADVVLAIDEHYQLGNSICVLSGVSGSGKSQAAISYVHHKSKEYENYIWISGDDWKDDTSLTSIQRTRGGAPINVEGSFNTVKTILVIDSYEKNLSKQDFSTLREGFDKGGIVLVTSQISDLTNDIYISKSELCLDVAYEILNETLESASSACEQFITACRFSPLVISTARKIMEDKNIPKEAFYKEALRAPGDMPGLEGVSIMRTILEKLDGSSLYALKKIANSGLSRHDIQFLHEFIGLFPCIALQRLSVLSPTNVPDIFKVHDFICLAVKDAIDASELTKAIDCYVGSFHGEMTPSVLREVHLARDELRKVHFSNSNNIGSWLTYALLQIENEEKEIIYSDLYKEKITLNFPLSKIMCIVDAKESYAYTIEDHSERQTFYGFCAEEYLELIESNVDEAIKAELLHHRAKSLRRCGQYQDALKCFNELLALRPNWHATYGQIAHLGSQYSVGNDIKLQGEKSLFFLLNCMLTDSSKVPLRVSLAALARLRSYSSVTKHIDKDSSKVQKLATIIALSALEGLDQFYEAFVSFTSSFSYHHSEVCVKLSEDVSNMLSLQPELVEKRQWVSACEALTNVAIAAGRAEKHYLSEKLSNSSLQFAEKLNQEVKLNSYNARAIAKAYIIAKDPGKALEVISKVGDKNVDHWLLYRKSEALIDTNKYELALKNATQAFELAQKDDRAKNRMSIYHEMLSKCYFLTGDSDLAMNEINFAIDNCTDEQYKIALVEYKTQLSI
ncbi:tetratricopeptide repeat protein [Photobacterium phosphoreum]|uniref:tetratricopeptide repeat protein n=1 Tax=Photobacterium phosphoreum TaxID=659 RepID=UPI0039AEB5E3